MDTRELLCKLGFAEVLGEITEKEPSYLYDFGNLQLTAAQVTNFYLRPVFSFGGVAYGKNSLGEISFELPIEVESFELGVALIAYGVGGKFQPVRPTSWLAQGRSWKNYLPWVRNRMLYESRPQCSVEREWFRVAAKKLRNLAITACEKDVAIFSFNGEVLHVSACEETYVMAAKGKPWDISCAIAASKLDFLPKHFMDEIVRLSVWEEHLTIGSRGWALVSDSLPAITSRSELEL